ncbi:hypothetical protein FH972_022938 [Carpinus fangiana]|uniref:DNA-directed RNA polymerase n=1 Tax=Carpinus fangiana TaxID=176857 RepID=A0A5N6KU80_9ROSI|nr:hypothetical protein FH972_022938 [Carpinus fangiana]
MWVCASAEAFPSQLQPLPWLQRSGPEGWRVYCCPLWHQQGSHCWNEGACCRHWGHRPDAVAFQAWWWTAEAQVQLHHEHLAAGGIVHPGGGLCAAASRRCQEALCQTYLQSCHVGLYAPAHTRRPLRFGHGHVSGQSVSELIPFAYSFDLHPKSCATCHLKSNSCPGHCGHIELPVPVYHPVYIEQLFRLLRAQCIFCYKLKLPRVEVNRYWCKLQLLRHGLLAAAEELDDIGHGKNNSALTVADEDSDDSEDSGPDADSGAIIDQRRAFVRRKLRDAGVDPKKSIYRGDRTEVVAEARKATLQSFYSALSSTQRCKNCLGVSPKYRKNKATSIFRKPLSAKDRARNAQNGLRAIENPLEEFNRLQKAQKKKLEKLQSKRAADLHADEAVADMDDSSQDEPEIRILDGPIDVDSEEDSDEEMIDAPAVNGSIAITEAAMGPTKKKSTTNEQESQKYLTSSEIRATLYKLFSREHEILAQVYGSASVTSEPTRPSADMFFITNLVVPPNKYRREQSKRGEVTESADNASYRNVLASCQEMSEIQRELRGEKVSGYTGRLRNFDDFQNAGVRLQDHVNSVIDKEKNPTTGAAAQRNPDGIKQKLEKKEGLFRMNIMGKRVNFAARSVISPDPNIESNEIGIPLVFAKKLTYPEPVTEHNFHELRDAVIRGDTYPGAAAIELETGQVVNLKHKNEDERLAIANQLQAPSSSAMTGNKNKKVHRHLVDRDVVIMNRQPTLHKPSMMVHRAKVLLGEKTIRMHYANCKTYNADFDGDEMNMHFPQNELARAEAKFIADNDNQYLSATAGEPLRGLIQDHISISVYLTSLDCFFTREEYQELLYSCLRPEDDHTTTGRIETLDPDIIKPKERWTGKQVISTILLNIRPEGQQDLELTSKSTLGKKQWAPHVDEEIVRIRDGLLITGILDKKQIGPSKGGLFHAAYETYGPEVCGKLISILGRVLTRMLNVRAFSCGIEDLVMTPEGTESRKERLREASTLGLKVASEFVKLESDGPKARDKELVRRLEQAFRHENQQSVLDAKMSSNGGRLTTDINECVPSGLVKQFPKNQMQVMTTSGAKGSRVNANQISCLLGQQVLEGRRVPIMVSGKSLPAFKPFDTSLRAGGYITDRFLTGVRPQEYYFHAMAGREGLIDTAVKTSRSGYLQRCLVKGLEGLRAEHDGSVRDSDGTMIQTLYGEDGLEIIKQTGLTDFKHQTHNFDAFFQKLNMDGQSNIVFRESDDMFALQRATLKEVKKRGINARSDPVISLFSPSANGGAVSERYWASIKAFYDDNKDHLKLHGIKKLTFEKVACMNYMKSVVQAGEAVGVVAGQSLGEPSTQMTLNTFHLAGHAAKNVTLGIPRLREILMTASMSIKTPTMTLYPIAALSSEGTNTFAKGISRLRLAEIVDNTNVRSTIGEGVYPDARLYDVQLNFYPGAEYTVEHAIKIADVAKTIELKFIPELRRLIKHEIKKRGEEQDLSSATRSDAQPEVGVSQRQQQDEQGSSSADNEGGDSDGDDGGDEDATNVKSRANRNEDSTYDDPDEEEEELAREDKESVDGSESEEDETYGGSPNSSDASDDEDQETKHNIASTAKERESRILNKFSDLTAFAFDDKTGVTCSFRLEYPTTTAKLLLQSLIKRAAESTLIQSIPGIISATFEEPKTKGVRNDEEAFVLTEGANLVAMRDYQHFINPNRIMTNDIGAVLQHYGVEACRSAIVRELGAVFEGHSIDVDPRHLTLVADYMTRGGGFSPFNRIGMKDKTSPFMKMSFETTFGVLQQAVFDGDRDSLDSPSSRITLGKVGKMGTGMVDVLMPLPVA